MRAHSRGHFAFYDDFRGGRDLQVYGPALDNFQGFAKERARQGQLVNAVTRFPLGCDQGAGRYAQGDGKFQRLAQRFRFPVVHAQVMGWRRQHAQAPFTQYLVAVNGGILAAVLGVLADGDAEGDERAPVQFAVGRKGEGSEISLIAKPDHFVARSPVEQFMFLQVVYGVQVPGVGFLLTGLQGFQHQLPVRVKSAGHRNIVPLNPLKQQGGALVPHVRGLAQVSRQFVLQRHFLPDPHQPAVILKVIEEVAHIFKCHFCFLSSR